MYKRKRYSQETIVEVGPGYKNAFEKDTSNLWFGKSHLTNQWTMEKPIFHLSMRSNQAFVLLLGS